MWSIDSIDLLSGEFMFTHMRLCFDMSILPFRNNCRVHRSFMLIKLTKAGFKCSGLRTGERINPKPLTVLQMSKAGGLRIQHSMHTCS